MVKAPEPIDSSTPGAQLDRLVEIMRILRSPDGCPWDREQTLKTLRPFLVEETYEVIDAINHNDAKALQNELGDFVFEAVFLAQVCEEESQFTLADALGSVAEKLIRRHPHVFDINGNTDTKEPLKSADEIKRRWEEIKAEEQKSAGQDPSVLGGLPRELPGLLRAYRMGRRVATVGFDWEHPSGIIKKVEEELQELKAAITEGNGNQIEEELGDLLFSLTNLSRQFDIDPEGALQGANDKFAARFLKLEQRFETLGRSLRDATLKEMDSEWQQVKRDATKSE
jgi:MazG family protein